MKKTHRPLLICSWQTMWLTALMCLGLFQCKKDNHDVKDQPIDYPPRLVRYHVSGTHLRLNYIDSTSFFQSDKRYIGSFDYQFSRSPGTSIGITVNIADSTDSIFSWEVYVDNKLYANAFGEGGAYFNIPNP